MSNSNYVIVFDDERLKALKTEILAVLFDKGYSVSKQMVEDIAIWAYGREDKAVYNATVKVTSAQSTTSSGGGK